MYPGSLEIRESVVEDVLIPIAEEMGLGFTLMDLYNYERQLKRERSRDVALTEEELKAADEEYHYWNENRTVIGSTLVCRCEKNRRSKRPSVFSLVLQRGIRTPDTLLKRQVLCLLSYWGCLAGMAGLEPTISESKSEVLPLHYIPPSISILLYTETGLCPASVTCGVGKGTRTLDTRNHNPVL